MLMPDPAQVRTVSQVLRQVQTSLAADSELACLWIAGEISNYKASGSGHLYFSLKDAKGLLSMVMFRQAARGLGFEPSDGMEVWVRGSVTVYPEWGRLQCVAEEMVLAGRGNLALELEALRSRLEAAGLFARKRPLPRHPRKVGVITSPTGSVLHDIWNILQRRAPQIEVCLIPSAVQGAEAPLSLVRALRLANTCPDLDLVILARGGGSLEDLWAFNDERVARAIYASDIPVVSAVGHETDFTISDQVADLRAPTPSAAAELVAQETMSLCAELLRYQHRAQRLILRRLQLSRGELEGTAEELEKMILRLLSERKRRLGEAQRGLEFERVLHSQQERLKTIDVRLRSGMDRRLREGRQRVQLIRRHPALARPMRIYQDPAQKVDGLGGAIQKAMRLRLSQLRADLLGVAGRLDGRSPLGTLARGFVVVNRGETHITRVRQLQVGERLSLRFIDGQASVGVIGVKEDGHGQEEADL